MHSAVLRSIALLPSLRCNCSQWTSFTSSGPVSSELPIQSPFADVVHVWQRADAGGYCADTDAFSRAFHLVKRSFS